MMQEEKCEVENGRVVMEWEEAIERKWQEANAEWERENGY